MQESITKSVQAALDSAKEVIFSSLHITLDSNDSRGKLAYTTLYPNRETMNLLILSIIHLGGLVRSAIGQVREGQLPVVPMEKADAMKARTEVAVILATFPKVTFKKATAGFEEMLEDSITVDGHILAEEYRQVCTEGSSKTLYKVKGGHRRFVAFLYARIVARSMGLEISSNVPVDIYKGLDEKGQVALCQLENADDATRDSISLERGLVHLGEAIDAAGGGELVRERDLKAIPDSPFKTKHGWLQAMVVIAKIEAMYELRLFPRLKSEGQISVLAKPGEGKFKVFASYQKYEQFLKAREDGTNWTPEEVVAGMKAIAAGAKVAAMQSRTTTEEIKTKVRFPMVQDIMDRLLTDTFKPCLPSFCSKSRDILSVIWKGILEGESIWHILERIYQAYPLDRVQAEIAKIEADAEGK